MFSRSMSIEFLKINYQTCVILKTFLKFSRGQEYCGHFLADSKGCERCLRILKVYTDSTKKEKKYF